MKSGSVVTAAVFLGVVAGNASPMEPPMQAPAAVATLQQGCRPVPSLDSPVSADEAQLLEDAQTGVESILRTYVRYPPKAMVHKEQGTLLIQAGFSREGKLSTPVIVQSSGVSGLDDAAVDAWKDAVDDKVTIMMAPGSFPAANALSCVIEMSFSMVSRQQQEQVKDDGKRHHGIAVTASTVP